MILRETRRKTPKESAKSLISSEWEEKESRMGRAGKGRGNCLYKKSWRTRA